MDNTLYNLTDKLLKLQAFVEHAENPEELAEAIAETEADLQLSIDEKLEGMMMIRQNKAARITGIEAEIERLKNVAEREKKQIAKIEKYAQEELSRLGHTYKDKKMATRVVGNFNLKFKKLPPKLDIIDASKIPAQFMNIPPTPAAKPDAKELLDLLKKKAEFLHGKKWTIQIDELALEEFGIRLVNNNSKFEIE